MDDVEVAGEKDTASMIENPIENMTALARAAVKRLEEEEELTSIPEKDEAWNAAFVQAIREHKEQFRKSKDLRNLLRITGELLYGKDIHWAMELVQNAEDAAAKHIVFVFQPDRVLVWNDGNAFRARDVWAICSAGHSAKRNKIGFFGIGFKSVYKLTASPEIYSGGYALRIEDKLYPTPMPARRRTERGAWFVLPVLEEQRGKLGDMIKALASSEFAQVLLTVTNLSQIRIIDQSGIAASGRLFRRELRRHPTEAWDECEIGGSWTTIKTNVWRRFFYETNPVPEGVSREGRTVEQGDRSVIIVARPIEGEVKDLPIHCFLPTAVNSQLRWLVQADFEPNASREQLRQSKWNEWLMKETGEAIARAVTISAQSLRIPPWDLIPLAAEVNDPQQIFSYDVATARLHDTPFVLTERGWRCPAEATWGYFPKITDVVLEKDLNALNPRGLSYVREEILGPIKADANSRAELVLKMFGAEAIDCSDIVRLFEDGESTFSRIHRGASWWIAALGLIARHGSDEEKEELAGTRCLPVRQGLRIQPAPSVDKDGYLVAFSRSDLTEDLKAYFGASQVHLIEPFLSLKSERRGEDDSTVDREVLTEILEMLEAEPFHVAPEVGPYHIVSNLVAPRLKALSELESLSKEDVDRAWRLFEYVRQKWPSYVSEYKRRRNDRATESAIAAELSQKLLVVTRSGGGHRTILSLRLVSDAYLPSSLLGWQGMDHVLSGDNQVAFVDEVYSKTLRISLKRRGGRMRGEALSTVDFLRLLGAPVGPRVMKRSLTAVTPRDIPWVNWSSVPDHRVGLDNDWDSPDLARLALQWMSLSQAARTSRGTALLRAIEFDWQRLSIVAEATASYFYRSWNVYKDGVPTTWVGRLQQIAWLPSAAGTPERPKDLVLDTPANRLAIGGMMNGVLKWRATREEAMIALGVRVRPSVERILETLATLRASEGVSPVDMLTVAKACYQVLSDHLRESGTRPNSTENQIVTRMRGSSGRGLIYAPPPEGVAGERWWPPSRTIQADAVRWVGPYLGQLANRYRQASTLWETLGIQRELTIELAFEVINRDLQRDKDQRRALEYYGRLVSFLNDAKSAVASRIKGETPALTTLGWKPPSETWWTNRPEILQAFSISVAWWQPGSRDPSCMRNASALLGIREVNFNSEGGPLTERWEVRQTEQLDLGTEARWQRALLIWPHLLREDNDPSQWPAIDKLAKAVQFIRPLIAHHLRVHFAFTTGDAVIRASINPPVALRSKDDLLIARSTSDLFSGQAAESLATMAEGNQRQWARELALLLSMAEHKPDELERYAAKFAIAIYQHREFEFVTADPETDSLDPSAVTRIPPKPKRQAESKPKTEEATPATLADPLRYKLVEATSLPTSGNSTTPSDPRKLRPPTTDNHDQDPTAGSPLPPSPQMRYSNLDIEGAARPFIEEYELMTRGCTIVRQGPNVGADYVASDGRYIEVKAFSSSAPDTFELEAPEWRAAQHPNVSASYWVYIVEHLRDGQAPRITAVFNPVQDDATSKEPTGKLKVRGWRNAKTQHAGVFGEREPSSMPSGENPDEDKQ